MSAIASGEFAPSDAPPPALPLTANDYKRRERNKMLALAASTVPISLLLALLYVVTGADSPILPIVLIVAISPLFFWQIPRVALYGVFAITCLIELFPLEMPDSITDRVPIFWNVNTIFQIYGHINFKAVPLNLLELMLLLAGLCSLFQSVFTQRARLRGGPLFGVIAAYLTFVMIGLLIGEAQGGDYKIALQEVRAQVYFGIVYLMAYNLVTERRQIDHFLWIAAICLAFKAALYMFRQYVTLHGAPLPDQGVGSHEEAFLFDGFFMLLLATLLCGSYPKLRLFMLCVLPIVLLGNLATNRRTGTAAFAVLIPVLFVGAYRALPQRRRMAMNSGITLLVCFSIYYPLFKNSTSLIGQPARSIKSQFQPDPRDASSNAYRDAENMDQMATIKSAPWGYGYGRHFIHAVPIADISKFYEFWDLIPHNQILWIWMRTGTFGFFAFWVMISTIIIYSAQLFRDDTLPIELRTLGLYAILIVGCQLIFGLLDLQMTNFRDMLFTATWVGLAAKARELAPKNGSGSGEGNRTSALRKTES